MFMGASLDHAVWFLRPVRADRWLLIDVNTDSLTGVRGLTIGRVFDDEGRHVATFTQEALVRERADTAPEREPTVTAPR
jgi:acyl-CoA thioesterase II